MKLLLTSAGFTNKSIVQALRDLTSKDFSKLKLAFIPTAANVEPGDKDWLIDDLYRCKGLGFAAIDIVDISALPKGIWLPRLQEAQIIMVGGGNTFHLMYWIQESGLQIALTELLTERVYVGISAGSMVTTKNLALSQSARLYSEMIGEIKNDEGLGFVSFHIRPHLNSPHFPKVRKDYLEKLAQDFNEKVYAIDDNTAIKVDGDTVKVVSEGQWLVFNDQR